MSKDDKPAAVDQQVIIEEAAPEVDKRDREENKAAQDYIKTAEKDDKPSMRVRVYSPFKDYFDGPALSLSAENATGPFDILPHHHHFISLLSKCQLVVRTAGEEDRKILISGGLLHAKADNVVIFLDV